MSDAPSPPPGDPAAGDQPAGPPPRFCEVCGAQLDPDQTYCLECGSPTPLAPRLTHPRGGVIAIALALALLGGGAGALAYAVSNDDSGGAASTTTLPTVTLPTAPTTPTTPTTPTIPTVTTPTVPTDTGTTGTLPTDTSVTTPTTPTATSIDTTTVPTDTAGTLPTDTAVPTDTTATTPPFTTTSGPTTDGQTTSEVPTVGGGSDWPSGQSGWTAVLSSVRDEAEARAFKTKVQAAGEPAGVLWSSDYSTLKPGYWVVFSGVFTTRAEATAQANKLKPQFPGAYPRQVAV